MCGLDHHLQPLFPFIPSSVIMSEVHRNVFTAEIALFLPREQPYLLVLLFDLDLWDL